MKTGMNAPDGMGMVVATADIQNCKIRNDTTHTRELLMETNKNKVCFSLTAVWPLTNVRNHLWTASTYKPASHV